ncbi:D-2-hydroxyacid dehydrogenase [Clostridium thermarum]|uniref:D-2-hydroxyacid dehydrogenase n=1 Tax=Clostridium thermarum TaxID=1716543 RepID=UPI0013D2E99B|nr:D-2-hydroxyacid dehydrogenase [Clostridium thermarum]
MSDINKIVITGRLYREIGEALVSKISKEILCLPEHKVTEKELRWADAYVAFKPTDNFAFYNIKWVHALGAGVDSFLFGRQWKKDVLLTRTICSFGKKISEYCLSYILSDLQHHREFKKNQQEKLWKQLTPQAIGNQTILILGTGVIGSEVAKSLSYFGAEVIGVSLSGKTVNNFNRTIKFSDVQEYLSRVDWLINTLPLTESTQGIIDDNIFKYLNSAGFINVGRGSTLNEKALLKALVNNNIKIAILDVFPAEPLPLESELWSNSNIIITPHISAITDVDEAVECFLNTLTGIESGETNLKNKVNIKKGY